MNLAKAPRSVILVLALMAVLSFGVGLWLEFFRGEWLQNHPYLSDILSGVTGFSTSALVAVVALNAVIRRARIKQWSVEMVRSLQAAASSAEGIANAVRSLVGEPRHENVDWLRTDLLSELKRLAGDIGSRAAGLDRQIDTQPEDWQALQRRVARFTSHVMPRIVNAFEAHEDPNILGPWRNIENDLTILNQVQEHSAYTRDRQADLGRQVCRLMSQLLVAIAQSPAIVDNYRMAIRDLPPELRMAEM